MRKYIDYNAELKALNEKAEKLKARKVGHLGELVTVTGADRLDIETLAGGLLAMIEANDAAPKESWRKRGQAFFQHRTRGPGRAAASSQRGGEADTAVRPRAEAKQARNDTRTWVVNRRERTRQLIELGGLVAKAGLVDLTSDDRAVLYGAFLAVANRLGGEDRERALTMWGRRGHRAFEAGSVNSHRVSAGRSAPG